MKTRNGFVSNSSSTSFIIAVKKNIPCPNCNRKDDDFLDSINKSADRRNCVDQISYEEVMKVITYMRAQENPSLIEDIKKYKSNNAWTLATITLSDCDDDLHNELHEQTQKGNVVVVYRDEY